MFNFTGGSLISSEDLNTILELLHTVQPGTVVEIGTYKGETTARIAEVLPQSTIYTISLLNPEHEDFHAGIINLSKEETGEQCKNLSNVVQIYGDSRGQSTWEQIPKNIDAFFIDGCHYYDYIITDTIYALTYNPELVIWHDYRQDIDFFIHNVVRAIDELKHILNINHIEATTICYWREDK